MNSTDITEMEFFEQWLLPLDQIQDGRLIRIRVVMMVWLVIAIAIGVPGNILVISAIALVKHLRQVPHMFLINLAVCDLGVMIMDAFVLSGVFYGNTFLPKYPMLCEVSGAMCMLSCFGSLWTMMFVAINRFIFICKNQVYRRFFDLRGTLLCIGLLWFCVLLLDLPNYPFLGFLGTGHVFTDLFLHCSFKVDGGQWWFNSIFFTGTALGVPLAIISVCYYQIWQKASKSSSAASKLSERRQREQKQLLISLVTIFVAFVVTWAPLGVIIALIGLKVDISPVIPFELVIFFDLWAHLNSTVNFIIYGATHRGFRQAYVELFCRAFGGRKHHESTTRKSEDASAATAGIRSTADTQM